MAEINAQHRTSVEGTRKSELASKSDVIVNPSRDLGQKLIEVMRSYKARPDNFRPIKVHGLD